MKKHYILIESGAKIRFDLSRLFYGEAYNMYLIIEKNLYTSLSTGALLSFNKIITLETNQFTPHNLYHIINDIITEYKILTCDLSINSHDEYSLINCAKLRTQLGIEGDTLDGIEPFIDKIKMKKKAAKFDQPKHIKFNFNHYQAAPESYAKDIINILGFPIFAKPTNMASCFKVSKINDKQELMTWLSQRNNSEFYELDEFIEGDMYHCDTIIENGRIKNAFLYKYSSPNADFMKGKPIGSLLLQVSNPLYPKLISYNASVIKEMSPPTNSVTHFEFFIDKQDKIIFLEIAARAPGFEIPYALEKMTHQNIEEVFMKLQMGIKFKFDFSNKGLFASYMRFPKKEGNVSELMLPHIGSHFSIQHFINVGEVLTTSNNHSEVASSIVFWHKNYEVLRKDFENLKLFKPYKLKP